MAKLIVAFRNFADAPKNAGERMTTELKLLGFLFLQSVKISKIPGPL